MEYARRAASYNIKVKELHQTVAQLRKHIKVFEKELEEKKGIDPFPPLRKRMKERGTSPPPPPRKVGRGYKSSPE